MAIDLNSNNPTSAVMYYIKALLLSYIIYPSLMKSML